MANLAVLLRVWPLLGLEHSRYANKINEETHMNDCLILVDLQNDYFPGGNMELVGIVEAAANAQILLNAFRKTQSPVVHIQHISARPGATFSCLRPMGQI